MIVFVGLLRVYFYKIFVRCFFIICIFLLLGIWLGRVQFGNLLCIVYWVLVVLNLIESKVQGGKGIFRLLFLYRKYKIKNFFCKIKNLTMFFSIFL